MDNPHETLHKFQSSLEPFIKPREQVNYIRRILAIYLGSCSHGGLVKRPLSLVDLSYEVSHGNELKGLHRDYIDAVKANVAAQQQFEEVRHVAREVDVGVTAQITNSDVLATHVHLAKLRQKRDRLLAIQRCLNSLAEKDASSADFLNIDNLFCDASPIPNVPKEVVNSIVAEQSTSQFDLKGRTGQLEKTVLRAKLLLRQEEQRLLQVKANVCSTSKGANNALRLEALHATRNELIRWIETELDKTPASASEAEAQDPSSGSERLHRDHIKITQKLEDIKEKYAQYLDFRKQLLAMVAHRPAGTTALEPSLRPQLTTHGNDSTSTPIGHLLTPYIEGLLSISRDQKAMIGQKSHMKSALGKQSKDACQVLGHLAEESQLLPLYPLKDSLRRRSGLWNELTSKTADRPDLSNRIKPWIFAADAAKIATLECVTETVESGQVALENSMKALQGIDGLLGQGDGRHELEDHADTTEEAFWLSPGGRGQRKHTEHKVHSGSVDEQDIWSVLHGNLGLLGQEEAT